MMFSTLSVFATLALSAFTAAVPVHDVDVNAKLSSGVAPITARDIDVDNIGNGVDILRRQSQSVTTIIQNTTQVVTVQVNQLYTFQADNISIESLTPLFKEIETAVAYAIQDIQSLAGGDVNDLLGVIDGVVATVSGIAQLVGDLLTLVLGVVGYLLSIIDSSELTCLLALVAGLLDTCVCMILCVIMVLGSVVDGLVETVLGLITSLVPIIQQVASPLVLIVFGML